MSNTTAAPMLGVVLDGDGLVVGVTTNDPSLEGIPVAVIDKGCEFLSDDETTGINRDGFPAFDALTYRVGGVYKADFDLIDL